MKFTRRTFLKIGASGVLSGMGYSTLMEPGRLSVERVRVKVPRLPGGLAGLRIAVLSDFHLQPFTQLPHIQHAI